MIPDHAATPAAPCLGSGVLFSCLALWSFLAGLALEVAVFATDVSPCAPRGLQQEVAVTRSPPLVPLASRIVRDEACSLIFPTLYDPEEFAALYHADRARAVALVADMTEPQRVRQALAYAAWLDYHGLEIDLATVLAAWEQG